MKTDPTPPRRRRLFLLSPAHCDGVRARQVRAADAAFDLAVRLRSARGAPLGEVFSFLSGLYFRGKLAYARQFAFSPGATAGVIVITPTDGLRSAETLITAARLEHYATVPIALDESRYHRPLARDTRQLAARLETDCEVVLLGSIATRKYLDVLTPALGERLRVPRAFVGRGDMSRGSLLLRCAATRRELEYVHPADLRIGRSGKESTR